MNEEPVNRNAVFQYARDRFGSEPEYLWVSSPDAAVLRCANNAKWYAVLMNVSRSRLGLSGEGSVDILDVKCEPTLAGSLRGVAGYLPAYHMNKYRWLTILLDGTVSMPQILRLLDWSYELASASKKPGRRAATGALE